MIDGRRGIYAHKCRDPPSSFMRRGEPLQRVGGAHELAAAVGAALDLDSALRKPLGPDQDLIRNADEFGGGEFRPRPLVEILVENLDAAIVEVALKPLAARLRC